MTHDVMKRASLGLLLICLLMLFVIPFFCVSELLLKHGDCSEIFDC